MQVIESAAGAKVDDLNPHYEKGDVRPNRPHLSSRAARPVVDLQQL
jgi:hypothetical protein